MRKDLLTGSGNLHKPSPNSAIKNITIKCYVTTVKFHNKHHLELRPPLLVRPLVPVPKYIFQCKVVSLMRPVHYKDHFR